MDRDTVARIEEWETHPYSGGHAGLRDLAQSDFSGTVSTAGSWVFMLNGRIVGLTSGSIAALADAEGTAYEAPHPSLPLLFAMQDRQGEVQAKYYTDDTPLSEVDETLRDANFTGYIVLSENVLSGDYYVVYYGGRSLSVAFIGNAERVVTGDEAFEKAANEVGIYEVRTVELDVKEVPPPDEGAEESTSSAVAGTEASGQQSSSTKENTPVAEGESPSSVDESVSRESGSVASEGESQPTEEAKANPEPPDPDATDQPASASSASEQPSETEPTEPPASPSDSTADTPQTQEEPPGATEEQTQPANAGAPEEEDPFSEEQEWRQARTIPALDPDETATQANEAASDPQQSAQGQTDTREPDRSTPNKASSSKPSSTHTSSSATQTASTPQQDELRTRLEELEEELNARQAEQDELRDDIDALRTERDELKTERDQLKARLKELEAADSHTGSPTTSGPNLERADAFTRTDLLVRYRSKSDATLQDAIDGTASKEDVADNLRLDDHTRFESDTATVAGQPFRDFLTQSVEYGFVNWFVSDLVFELRDTGNQKALGELYETIPKIDRIEFQGTITAQDEDGDEVSRTFDLVMRDRMGQALVVANINDARDPATDTMMEDLIDSAATIGEHVDMLGAAFLVTSSFFEPGALEMATNASGGGFLNRGSKKSFVRLTRKQGYHLCLVEARDETFHIAVPEL